MSIQPLPLPRREKSCYSVKSFRATSNQGLSCQIGMIPVSALIIALKCIIPTFRMDVYQQNLTSFFFQKRKFENFFNVWLI